MASRQIRIGNKTIVPNYFLAEGEYALEAGVLLPLFVGLDLAFECLVIGVLDGALCVCFFFGETIKVSFAAASAVFTTRVLFF